MSDGIIFRRCFPLVVLQVISVPVVHPPYVVCYEFSAVIVRDGASRSLRLVVSVVSRDQVVTSGSDDRFHVVELVLNMVVLKSAVSTCYLHVMLHAPLLPCCATSCGINYRTVNLCITSASCTDASLYTITFVGRTGTTTRDEIHKM